MPAKTLTLGGKRFVILPEAEYKLLRSRAGETASKRNGHPRVSSHPTAKKKAYRMTAQDRGDVAESIRRLKEPGESIPWSRIKAERGL